MINILKAVSWMPLRRVGQDFLHPKPEYDGKDSGTWFDKGH